MTKEKTQSKNELSKKMVRSAKTIKNTAYSSERDLTASEIQPRSEGPELSVVNVIERISKMLRTEAREFERKKAIGE